jgi:hypothetical protein
MSRFQPLVFYMAVLSCFVFSLFPSFLFSSFYDPLFLSLLLLLTRRSLHLPYDHTATGVIGGLNTVYSGYTQRHRRTACKEAQEWL